MSPGTHPEGTQAVSMREMFKYVHGQRGALSSVITLSVVSALCSLAQPLMVQSILDRVSRAQPAALVALLLLVLVIAASALDAFRQFLLGRCAERVVLNVRKSLTSRLLRLPIKDFDRRSSGDLQSRVSTDTSVLRGVLTGGLVDSLGASVIFVGSVVAMVLIDPYLLLTALAVVLSSVTVLAFASKRIQPLALAAQEAVGDLTAGVGRSLTAIRTLRALGATPRVEEQLHGYAEDAFASGVGVERVRALLEPTSALAVQAALLTVLGVGGYRVAAGDLEVSSLITFVLFLFMMLNPVSQGFQAVISLRTAMGALTRIEEVMCLPPEGSITDLVVACPPALVGRRITLRGVSFGYTPSRPVLSHVDLEVPAGSTTAIVGLSGSGKSTILALIERFYELDAGSIAIDGIDICSLTRDDLRAQIGYVEQQAPVLAGSIRDNLLIAAPDTTDEDLRNILGAVDLLTRVEEHPEGLNAEIGDGGVGLSGGERQRLAVARVLLDRRPVLLLDEATSALDPRSDLTTRNAIRLLGGQSTIVVVAHRLATVREADQIVLLHEGHVRAVGRHDDLLADELYRELASYQLAS